MMYRYTVREVEMINEYFEAEAAESDGDATVVSARTAEDERAETERRRVARIELQARLAAEAQGG